MLGEVPAVVIWNPSAGSVQGADELLKRLQLAPQTRILQSESRDDAIRKTIAASLDGAELVVAAGGDGSINAVVEGLIQSRSNPTLGILPLGTGNDLARTLGLPLDPPDALQTLTTGRKGLIDVVQLTSSESSRCSVNMLTAGNSGRYLRHLTDDIKRRWGPFCYLRGTIEILQDLQVYQMTLRCDDQPPEQFSALNVFLANGSNSGGGLVVSPDAELDDGQVDVVIIQDGHAGEIASLTTDYVVADYLQHHLVAFRRAQRVQIDSDPPLPLTADGDDVGHTPLSVSVRDRSLSVIIPAGVDR